MCVAVVKQVSSGGLRWKTVKRLTGGIIRGEGFILIRKWAEFWWAEGSCWIRGGIGWAKGWCLFI